ncbi:MAG: PA0069 family radical SAM protein [Balneolia bacterium]|nr:PA0069 family radical SAM protein [Balneolia bacterium]
MNCNFQSASNRLRAERGRGTSINPANRFEPLHFEQDDEFEAEQGKTKTKFLRDDSGSILSSNNSPDIPFSWSLNPYRGCEHGCMYCYARPTHEYLGFSAGLDFESIIMVKENAPELLRKKLSSRSWQAEPVILSGITDPYQPAERRFELTRRCLEVFAEFRNPVSIITKNHLVTRDIDILSEMAAKNLARVNISVTSLDPSITSTLEPRTSRPARRLDAIRKLSEAGIPAGVMTAPIIPGLNDYEIPDILKAASEAGAVRAGYVMLRLPWGVKELFADWLEHHHPDKKDKIMNRVSDIRGGKLNDSTFGSRMKGEGEFAEQVKQMFRIASRRYGLDNTLPPLSTDHFRKVVYGQQELF